MSGYAELHCLSNFTFLRGASHPGELVQRASELGYRALALTDECSVAGVVRAHTAARELGLHLIIGSEFTLHNGDKLILLVMNRQGYRELTRLITAARRHSEKGCYQLDADDLCADRLQNCLALIASDPAPAPNAVLLSRYQALLQHTQRIQRLMPGRIWITLEQPGYGADHIHSQSLLAVSQQTGVPLVAAGNVHMHIRARQPLQDTLCAIRCQQSVADIRHTLAPNAERHLRTQSILEHIYPRPLLDESIRIADQCRFSLDELRYHYPCEQVPDDLSPTQYLRQLVDSGIRRRWPDGPIEKVTRQISHELSLIAELGYEGYFLTVYDIVCFAKSRGILCQGRGSAANSAVCFALGITEVDPAHMEILFERFVSRERNEPPDIDVDFEHERREEVMQYVYRRYGRHRAALTSAVITYRSRSAVRDVGRALGLSQDQIERLAGNRIWWQNNQVIPERVREIGLDPKAPLLFRVLELVQLSLIHI